MGGKKDENCQYTISNKHTHKNNSKTYNSTHLHESGLQNEGLCQSSQLQKAAL